MRVSGHVGRALGCGVLMALDQLFARLCVEVDAAGALLSPGGAVPLGAFAAAGTFLILRLALVAALCLTAALIASDLAGRLLRPVLPDRGDDARRSERAAGGDRRPPTRQGRR